MINLVEAKLHKVINTDNGKGGFVEALDVGRLIWVALSAHNQDLFMLFQREEAVKVDDQIQIAEDTAFYRVSGKSTVLNSHYQRWSADKVEKPLVPIT